MVEITPKMPAKNHFPDIIGINLEYALDAYDWEGWKPMHLQPVFRVERLKAEGSKLEAGENDPQISQITRINGRKKAQNTQNKNT